MNNYEFEEIQTTLQHTLPRDAFTAWQDILATYERRRPLMVSIVGPFSAGKSSLVNMLTEPNLLPTGQSETTAIPTAIRHGANREYKISRAQEEIVTMDAERFHQESQVPTSAGDYAEVTLCLDWLKGLTLIDLPGLGSVHEQHARAAHAEIAASDVILYVLSNRGPSALDLEAISRAAARGKTIHVLVSRWDEVLESQSRGEKLPNLSSWAKTVSDEAKLELSILPVSYTGHGKEELLEMLEALSTQQEQIREKRFVAETTDLIETRLDQLREELVLSQRVAAGEFDKVRDELIAQKTELQEAHNRIHQQHKADQEKHLSRFKELAETQASIFEAELRAIAPLMERSETQTQWEDLQGRIRTIGEQTLTPLIELCGEFNEAVAASGHGEWEAVGVKFPKIPMDRDDWWQAAEEERLTQLLHTLKTNMDSYPKSDATQVEYESTLEMIKSLNQELGSQYRRLSDIPKIARKVGGNQVFSKLGRGIGEAADLALIFVQPATIAKTIGKSAALSKHLPTVLKGMKALEKTKAIKYAKNIHGAATGMERLRSDNRPGQFLQGLGWLDKFSIAYWTESLGALLDEEPQIIYEPDPHQLADHKAAIKSLEDQKAEFQNELRRLSDKLHNQRESEAERERTKQEIAQLELKLAQTREAVEREQTEWLERQARKRAERIKESSAVVMERARREFDVRIHGLRRELESSWQKDWEFNRDVALSEKDQEIQSLQDNLSKLGARSEESIADLQNRISQLELIYSRLTRI